AQPSGFASGTTYTSRWWGSASSISRWASGDVHRSSPWMAATSSSRAVASATRLLYMTIGRPRTLVPICSAVQTRAPPAGGGWTVVGGGGRVVVVGVVGGGVAGGSIRQDGIGTNGGRAARARTDPPTAARPSAAPSVSTCRRFTTGRGRTPT